MRPATERLFYSAVLGGTVILLCSAVLSPVGLAPCQAGEPPELALDRVLLDMEALRVAAVRAQAPDAGGELQQRAAFAGGPGLGCGRHRHGLNSQTGTLGPACGVRR